MESIAEIKKVFADADISEYSGLIEKYGDDERDGVKKIIVPLRKRSMLLKRKKPAAIKCLNLRENTLIRDIYVV